MKILAHRGDTSELPANTSSSIKRALENEHSIEVDVRFSRDGQFVANHDAEIKINGESFNINETEIRKIKRANEEAKYLLPSLKTLLNIFAKKNVDSTEFAIHLKDYHIEKVESEIIKDIKKINERYSDIDLLNRVFIFDITVKNAQRIKSIEPEINVGLSVGEDDFFPKDGYPTIYEYNAIRHLNVFDIVWADEWVGGLYKKNFFEKCKSDGYRAICISPELHSNTDPSHPKKDKYESYWEVLESAGADGICTDHPNMLKKVLSL